MAASGSCQFFGVRGSIKRGTDEEANTYVCLKELVQIIHVGILLEVSGDTNAIINHCRRNVSVGAIKIFQALRRNGCATILGDLSH